MENEKIDPTTGKPVIETPSVTPPATPPATPPEPPEPKEPSLGEVTPKIEVKEKDDEGNELTPEEKSANYAKAASDASLENTTKIRVDNTVNNYLHDHPEYAPFAEKIKTWVNHPNRFGLIKNGLPVENVIIEAIGVKNLMRLGAEMATKSKIEADATAGGGTPPAPTKTEVTSLRSMDFKDFHNIQEMAKAGKLQSQK